MPVFRDRRWEQGQVDNDGVGNNIPFRRNTGRTLIASYVAERVSTRRKITRVPIASLSPSIEKSITLGFFILSVCRRPLPWMTRGSPFSVRFPSGWDLLIFVPFSVIYPAPPQLNALLDHLPRPRLSLYLRINPLEP